MSLKPYPEYKDSGVKRIGQVPADWRVGRLKDSVRAAKNGVWGSDPDGGDLDLRCVRVADFDRPHLAVHNRNSTKRSVSLSDREGRLLSKGDLLLEKSGGGEKSPVGFVVLVDIDEPAVCSNFVARMTLNAGMDSRYWNYVHSSNYSIRLTQRSIKQATGIQNLDQASYLNEAVAYPSSSVQGHIADFLDRETAEIDAFIADQEELIALLNERRKSALQTVIGSAVDGPRVRLRYLYRQSRSANRTDLEVLSVYREFGVIPKSSRSDNFNKTPEDVSRYLVVEPGYLVVNKMKAWQGSLGVSDYKGIVSPDYEVLVPTSDALLPAFAHQMLRSAEYVANYAVRSVGIRPSQWRLYWDQLKDIHISVPSKSVQAELVLQLQVETTEVDATMADARQAIELSKERRAALISAAVTGKIDVRDAMASKQQLSEGELAVY